MKSILGGGGFGKVDRKNLVLTVGQILTVDAALPPASVSTDVIVTSETRLSTPKDRGLADHRPDLICESSRQWPPLG